MLPGRNKNVILFEHIFFLTLQKYAAPENKISHIWKKISHIWKKMQKIEKNRRFRQFSILTIL